MNIWGGLLALCLAACTSSAPLKQYEQPAFPYVARPTPDAQGDRAAMVFFIDQSLTAKKCEEWGADINNALACAGFGFIILPNPCEFSDERYAQIACHELGHLNGWHHD